MGLTLRACGVGTDFVDETPSVRVAPASLALQVGEQAVLSGELVVDVEGEPVAVGDAEMGFRSDDPSVAAVDEEGRVRAGGPGQTRVIGEFVGTQSIAAPDAIDLQTLVTVVEDLSAPAVVEVTGLTGESRSARLALGSTLQLSARVESLKTLTVFDAASLGRSGTFVGSSRYTISGRVTVSFSDGGALRVEPVDIATFGDTLFSIHAEYGLFERLTVIGNLPVRYFTLNSLVWQLSGVERFPGDSVTALRGRGARRALPRDAGWWDRVVGAAHRRDPHWAHGPGKRARDRRWGGGCSRRALGRPRVFSDSFVPHRKCGLCEALQGFLGRAALWARDRVPLA